MYNYDLSSLLMIELYISDTEAFTLDLSMLDKDTLSTSAGTTVWTNFTCDIVSLEIDRNLEIDQGVFARPQVGTAKIRAKGLTMDPFNDSRIRPNIPMRVVAFKSELDRLAYTNSINADLVTYPEVIYTGVLNGIDGSYDPEGNTYFDLSAVDSMYTILNTNMPEWIVPDFQTFANRMNWIYYNVNLANPSNYINTATVVGGKSKFTTYDDIDQNSGDWVNTTLDGEAGMAFANVNGTIQTYGRNGFPDVSLDTYDTSSLLFETSHTPAISTTNYAISATSNFEYSTADYNTALSSTIKLDKPTVRFTHKTTNATKTVMNATKLPISDVTKKYTTSVYLRMSGATAVKAAQVVKVYDATDTLLGTISGTLSANKTPSNWYRFDLDLDLSSYTTATYIKIGFNSQSSNTTTGIYFGGVAIMPTKHICFSNIDVVYDTANMYNSVTATLSWDNLTSFTNKNDGLIAVWGQNPLYVDIDVADSANLQSWVNDITLYQPQKIVRSVTINVADNPFATLQNNEIAQTVGLNAVFPEFSIKDHYMVTGVTHNVDPDGWFITYHLWKTV